MVVGIKKMQGVVINPFSISILSLFVFPSGIFSFQHFLLSTEVILSNN